MIYSLFRDIEGANPRIYIYLFYICFYICFIFGIGSTILFHPFHKFVPSISQFCSIHSTILCNRFNNFVVVSLPLMAESFFHLLRSLFSAASCIKIISKKHPNVNNKSPIFVIYFHFFGWYNLYRVERGWGNWGSDDFFAGANCVRPLKNA